MPDQLHALESFARALKIGIGCDQRCIEAHGKLSRKAVAVAKLVMKLQGRRSFSRGIIHRHGLNHLLQAAQGCFCFVQANALRKIVECLPATVCGDP